MDLTDFITDLCVLAGNRFVSFAEKLVHMNIILVPPQDTFLWLIQFNRSIVNLGPGIFNVIICRERESISSIFRDTIIPQNLY